MLFGVAFAQFKLPSEIKYINGQQIKVTFNSTTNTTISFGAMWYLQAGAGTSRRVWQTRIDGFYPTERLSSWFSYNGTFFMVTTGNQSLGKCEPSVPLSVTCGPWKKQQPRVGPNTRYNQNCSVFSSKPRTVLATMAFLVTTNSAGTLVQHRVFYEGDVKRGDYWQTIDTLGKGRSMAPSPNDLRVCVPRRRPPTSNTRTKVPTATKVPSKIPTTIPTKPTKIPLPPSKTQTPTRRPSPTKTTRVPTGKTPSKTPPSKSPTPTRTASKVPTPTWRPTGAPPFRPTEVTVP